jgi:mono/diheme cytochrome c family protein
LTPKLSVLLILALMLSDAAFWAAAQERAAAPHPASIAAAGSSSSAAAKPASTQSETTTRLEGEKRFKANCARCHTAPHKFAPRMMATIIRHMRVRSTITDEDARLIWHYMSQ